ncbi:MAG: glycosyltransferase family 2 protein [Clostridiales bacterium]|nr:glycosyltransferase family 2 protein [Clostridiales bacterium]
MSNEIVAVVVTYNRKDLLKQNLQALLNQQNVRADVFVVDNASNDGTEQMIRDEFDCSEIHYFNTGANLGGAGGFQYGVREAIKADYKYVWIMDDDTVPNHDSLCKLYDAAKLLPDNWGALSSKALWTDESVCKANRQKKTLMSFVTDEEYSKGSPIKVEMASFVSLLVKAEVISKIGLPIGEYFIWTDDYEFTGRINRAGYGVYVIPDSVVHHKMKENKKINFAKETPDRIDRYKYVYRNDVHCYKQYGLRGNFYLFAKIAFTVLNILIKSPSDKKKKIKILFDGIREGKSFNPSIEFVS